MESWSYCSGRQEGIRFHFRAVWTMKLLGARLCHISSKRCESNSETWASATEIALLPATDNSYSYVTGYFRTKDVEFKLFKHFRKYFFEVFRLRNSFRSWLLSSTRHPWSRDCYFSSLSSYLSSLLKEDCYWSIFFQKFPFLLRKWASNLSVRLRNFGKKVPLFLATTSLSL